jgi:hypothetical protein
MTKLEIAFAEAAKLPPNEQDALAIWILEEIASETRWAERYHRSQDKLSKLADEALQEYLLGKTKKLDPDKL